MKNDLKIKILESIIEEQEAVKDIDYKIYFDSFPGLQKKWESKYTDPEFKQKADSADAEALKWNKNNIEAIRSGRKEAKLLTIQKMGNNELDDWFKNTSAEDRAMKDYSGKPSARAKFYKEMEDRQRKKAPGGAGDLGVDNLDVSKLGDDDVYDVETKGWRNEDPLGLSGQGMMKFQKDIVGRPGDGGISPEALKRRSKAVRGIGSNINPETAGALEDVVTTILPSEISDIPLTLALPGLAKGAGKAATKGIKKGIKKIKKSPGKAPRINFNKGNIKSLQSREATQIIKNIDSSKFDKLLKSVSDKVPRAYGLKDELFGGSAIGSLLGKASAPGIYALSTIYRGLGKNETLDREILGKVRKWATEDAPIISDLGFDFSTDKDVRRLLKSANETYKKSQEDIFKIDSHLKKNKGKKNVPKNHDFLIKQLIDGEVFPRGDIDEKILKRWFNGKKEKFGPGLGEYKDFLKKLKQAYKQNINENMFKEHIVNLVIEKFGY